MLGLRSEKWAIQMYFRILKTSFRDFLGSFFGNVLPARTQATRCEFCGSTYAEIEKSGQVGCAKCYELFCRQALPVNQENPRKHNPLRKKQQIR